METFNPSSLTMPFPYNSYTTLTNVATFSPTHFTTTTTTTTTVAATMANMRATTTPWMDSRIWSRIPQQLLDRILAFLPPPAFFRARSVCKRWYALLFSNTFLQLYLQVCPTSHWFIFFIHKTSNNNIIYKNNNNNNNQNSTNEGINSSSSSSSSSSPIRAYLFDPYELKWYTISFPLIPLGFTPATSSGGLICWVSNEPGPKNIFLHNPLVGSLTQLPPTLHPRLYPSVGLSITPTSILMTLAGDDLISPYAVKNLTTETFHVDSTGFYSVWDTTSTLPRLCSLESGQMVHSHGSRFYCMDYSPFSVLVYDLNTNTTWKIQAPMRRFLRSPSLVEGGGGKVLLVAAVEKSKLNVPRSFRVWMLQACGTQWVEIERMPQQLYAQFEDIEGGRGFECVGHGEFIVVMIKGINKGLLFDIVTKTWVWMPNCPLINHNHDNNNMMMMMASSGGDLHGFAYQPTLAAPVTALVHHLTTTLPFQSFTG